MSPFLPPSLVQRNPEPVLEARQSVQTIGATTGTQTGCGGQYTGGVLAGAIVGTFFGTILLLYLFQTLTENRKRQETVIVEKRRTGSRRHRSHSGSSSVRRPSRVYSTG